MYHLLSDLICWMSWSLSDQSTEKTFNNFLLWCCVDFNSWKKRKNFSDKVFPLRWSLDLENFFEKSEVEPSARARYSSQLQLSPRPKMLVGWLVGWLVTLKLEETALRIFLKLCTMIDIDKLWVVTEPDFPKKFWIIQNSQKSIFADFAISDGFFEESEASC